MLEDSIELFKLVGSFGGFASAIFLIYDRVVRLRPSIFLGPKDYKTNLHIKNIADETIIIDEVKIDPPFLIVHGGNDLVTEGEEKAAILYPSQPRRMPDRVLIVVKASSERSFALHRLADFENAGAKSTIKIRCRWRNTRGSFPWARYVWLKTTVEDVRNITEASVTHKV